MQMFPVDEKYISLFADESSEAAQKRKEELLSIARQSCEQQDEGHESDGTSDNDEEK